MRSGLRLFSVLLLFAAAGIKAEGATPPALTADLESSYAGSTGLHGNGADAASGGSRTLDVSALYRARVGPAGGCVQAGPEFTDVSFGGGSPRLPSRLQSLSVQVAVEYFLEGEEVAALTFHPGWYYENRMTADSFDVPVEFTSGVPLSGSFNGVVGVTNARFYHHAIPVIGFQWDPSRRLRITGVFPNPSAVLSLDGGWSARLGGELGGGGYRTAADAVVEYWTYRAGAGVEWKGEGADLRLSVGDEVERGFDFYKHGPELRGGGAPYASISLVLSR